MTKSLESILKEFSCLPAFTEIRLDGPNTRGNFGDYPLHIAVILGNTEYVSVLIAAGSNINQKGEHGYTPLHEAIEQDHYEIAEILLKSGASISIENDEAASASEFANIVGSEEMKKIVAKYKRINEE